MPAIPAWALARPKRLLQHIWDFIGIPARMVLLPDLLAERLHLTSIRAERMAVVLPVLRGRLLDVGAGDNVLVHLYRETGRAGSEQSVGIDTVDWGSDCQIVPDTARLPLPDRSFDTVSFIASINHIPERRQALAEAHRVLKDDGCLLVTMISRLVGDVGHAIWWYSEEKHREVAPGEVMGLDRAQVLQLLREGGFGAVVEKRFFYRMNTLYLARKFSQPESC